MSDDMKLVTVGELIEHLKQFDAATPVIYQCCSDWSALGLEDVRLVSGVRKDHWIMRAYLNQVASMSEENQAGIRQFVAFPGN